jgi:hypothetical protein
VTPYAKGYEDALRDVMMFAFFIWAVNQIDKGKLFKDWKPSLTVASLFGLTVAFGALLSLVIFPIIHLLTAIFSTQD